MDLRRPAWSVEERIGDEYEIMSVDARPSSENKKDNRASLGLRSVVPFPDGVSGSVVNEETKSVGGEAGQKRVRYASALEDIKETEARVYGSSPSTLAIVGAAGATASAMLRDQSWALSLADSDGAISTRSRGADHHAQAQAVPQIKDDRRRRAGPVPFPLNEWEGPPWLSFKKTHIRMSGEKLRKVLRKTYRRVEQEHHLRRVLGVNPSEQDGHPVTDTEGQEDPTGAVSPPKRKSRRSKALLRQLAKHSGKSFVEQMCGPEHAAKLRVRPPKYKPETPEIQKVSLALAVMGRARGFS